jgi:hypothetical protein
MSVTRLETISLKAPQELQVKTLDFSFRDLSYTVGKGRLRIIQKIPNVKSLT